jgi:hypothetical protein
MYLASLHVINPRHLTWLVGWLVGAKHDEQMRKTLATSSIYGVSPLDRCTSCYRCVTPSCYQSYISVLLHPNQSRITMHCLTYPFYLLTFECNFVKLYHLSLLFILIHNSILGAAAQALERQWHRWKSLDGSRTKISASKRSGRRTADGSPIINRIALSFDRQFWLARLVRTWGEETE